MSLKEQSYRVLIVSSSEKFSTALSSMLSESGCDQIQRENSITGAKRAFSEKAYDYVIINSPLPDDPGISFAIDLCALKSTVALLIVKAELHDEIHDKVASYGVFTLSKPLSRLTMSNALSWMQCARERLRRLENYNLSIEEKMKEIRLVNKAKWLLIREIKMDEPTAHRYIEKQAMDRCVSKRTIAEEIINTYD
ncbi:MAG: ANTAR domain-containing response regulator [Candidatus Avilachnospira sp.]